MKVLSAIEKIQFILAPVVMLTACALLLNNLGGRYTEISNRLRALSHERFELLRMPNRPMQTTDFVELRLYQIDRQVPSVLHQYQSLHQSILMLYISTALFLASMFALAWAAILEMMWVEAIALGIFLIGIGFMFVSILFTALHFRFSHQATELEAKHLCGLRGDAPQSQVW